MNEMSLCPNCGRTFSTTGDRQCPYCRQTPGLLNQVERTLMPQPLGTYTALLEDVRSSEEVMSMELPDTPDFIARGYKIGLIGEMQTGKSCLAIGIGIDLAMGRNILAYFDNDRQWRVLYINYELPEAEVDVRLNLFDITPNFLRVTIPQMGLETEQGYRQVADYLELERRSGTPIDCLILDAKSHCMAGDENQTQDQNSWNTACDRLIEDYGVALIIVHHFGRSQQPGGRGSTAFGGWLTKRLELKATSSNPAILEIHGKVGEAPKLPLEFQYPSWKVQREQIEALESKTERAMQFIVRELSTGDQLRKDLAIKAQREERISMSTFKAALRCLGDRVSSHVDTTRQGNWRMLHLNQ